MEENNQIYIFASKWLEKYQNPKTESREFEIEFADECFEIGFKMDCGKAFEKAFPEVEAINDLYDLDQVINQVYDVFLLGSLIFSKWRWITHWSRESLLSEKNKKWFVLAFSRLVDLTAKIPKD